MQYFQSIIRYPTLDDIEDKSTFKERIDSSRVRVDIQNHNSENSYSLSKASDPGKLNQKMECIACSWSIRDYLSTILGNNGVLLSYVIRENPYPANNGEDDKDYGSENLSINCAPFSGILLKTDVHKVNQLIHVFAQGGTFETCIKPR